MWVDPAARGSGVAAALIGAVVEWARSAGRATYLMVRSENARAIAAYARAGFVDLGIPTGQTPTSHPRTGWCTDERGASAWGPGYSG